jgi:predicted component of type VI protein secretion system
MFKLGLLVGAAYATWRWFEARRSESGMRWEPQPAPYPPQPRVESSSSSSAPRSAPAASAVSAPATAPAPASAPAPVPEAARAAPTTERAPAASGASDSWVEPVDRACPVSHPVKAKMSSRIFHVEGGLNYARTKPDRCYRDPAAAEADGLRKAAR